jgi:hypothetical protein
VFFPGVGERDVEADAPDIHFVEGEQVAEGNLVEPATPSGGPIRTEEGTTKVIAAEGMQLFRIGDGVIQEIHSYFDRLAC